MNEDKIGYLIYYWENGDEYTAYTRNIAVVKSEEMAKEYIEILEYQQAKDIAKYDKWRKEKEEAFDNLGSDASEEDYDNLDEEFEYKKDFDYNGYDEKVFGYYEIRLMGF